jgi:hypothetical protein
MDDEENNYKSKCDEILLPRNSSNRGVTFDKAMTDEEVMDILQGLINGS